MRRGCGEPARLGGGLVEGQNAELGDLSSVGSCTWGSRRLGRWRPGELQKLGCLGVSPAHEAPRSPEGGASVQDEGPGLGTEQRPPRPLGPAGDSAIQTALDGRGDHAQSARRRARASDSEGRGSGRGGRRRAEVTGPGSGEAWAGASAPPPSACVPRSGSRRLLPRCPHL